MGLTGKGKMIRVVSEPESLELPALAEEPVKEAPAEVKLETSDAEVAAAS